VAFDPVDFIARLAALVPKPRVNLTRYHGVLAPNHRLRGLIVDLHGILIPGFAWKIVPPE